MKNPEDGNTKSSESPPTRLEDGSPKDLPFDETAEQEQIGRLLRLAGARRPVPAEREARVRTAVHAEWQRDLHARSHRGRWLRGALALAAVLVISLGLGIWQRLLRSPTPGAPVVVATVEKAAGTLRGEVPARDPAAAPAEAVIVPEGSAVAAGTWLETGSEGRAALRLHGGASLRINVATRLRLASPDVLVLERGEIYLASPAVPLLPPSGRTEGAVEIRTPYGSVRELGTQFGVGLLPAALRVRVREGAVVVGRDGGSEQVGAGVELTVEAGGDAGTGDGGSSVTRRAIPLHGREWAWVLRVAPDFELEGRTLGEFLDWVVRETGWQLRFGDEATARLAPATVLHGTAAGMAPDEAPAAILPTCGLSSRLEDGVLVVEPGRLQDSP